MPSWAYDQRTSSGYAYDGNGNPTTYRGTALIFDPEDRLTGYGSAETNAYTGDGLRAEKSFGGAHVWYVYDGDVPVAEINGSGQGTAAHTFGPNGLVSRLTPVSDTFYTFDPQGAVAQQLDRSGAVVCSALHDAFGNWVSSGGGDDVFGFGGQFGYYTDSQTGLRVLGRRSYDNVTGRFLTRDPLGYAGGRDLYAYVGNNPANLSDPSGLCPDDGSMGGELHDNYRRNHVNQQIDQTEMILVTAALGAAGGAELGPWVGLERTEGGAVLQSLPDSCVSACGEMLTDGAVTQAQFLEEMGEGVQTSRNLAAALRSLGQGFWSVAPSYQAADLIQQLGSVAAYLRAEGADDHMVVMELTENGFLVRDPAFGGTYKVTSDWIDQFVQSVVYYDPL